MKIKFYEKTSEDIDELIEIPENIIYNKNDKEFIGEFDDIINLYIELFKKYPEDDFTIFDRLNNLDYKIEFIEDYKLEFIENYKIMIHLKSYDKYMDFYEIHNPEIKIISNCEIEGEYDVIMNELRKHGNCKYLSDAEIIEYFNAKISII